ncbi:MAG: aspartate aminotransferase family protein [Solirubrobacterales bacterium]|nr:aspartate aminotransferase family protein [Solirubrobacterales bacterium]
MTDPLLDRDSLDEVLMLVAEGAARYLGQLDDAAVRPPAAEPGAALAGPLPSKGTDALEAVRFLLTEAGQGATRSAGPRFFHFVMGGGTPAALAADWLTSALDQIAFNWVSSPMAMRIEQITLEWLKELFGLPSDWSGVLTSGATMANFTCLAAARRWWGQQHGVDVEVAGLAGLPPVPVLSSGYIHASALKALSELGIGRAQVQTLTADPTGRLDLRALEAALSDRRTGPAILIATAGEVNAGAFDPIADMADLAKTHGAWLHVDAAFGLFAAVSPSTQRLVHGTERARSVSVDGHKWLNVPYDCGAAFIDDPILHRDTFSASAAYLGSDDPGRPAFGDLAPEMSRRARALPAWATLHAYGRDGYRAMVERHLELARRLADQIDAEPDLECLADVALNVVCFRYHPRDALDSELDALNRRLGDAVLDDGQIYFGTTVYAGRVAFRPAIVNWRTQPHDIDLIVPTVLRLGRRLQASNEPRPLGP